MRERWHMPLAMWRVHFDLLGGFRRAGMVLLGYVLAMSLGLYMFRRALPDMSLADFSAGFINFLIAAQGLVLVVGGSTSIYRAMLRDFDLRMLESHRLTPMSNSSVILGYATGPAMQMLFVALLNLLVGSLFCFLAKKPLIVWLGGNALILLGAVVFWSFTVFIGLRKAKPLNPMVFLALVGMFGIPVLPLPAIGSFLGIYPLMCGFVMARESMKIPPGLIAAVIIVSLTVATFWFSIAAAKYRRPDLPALNGFRGLVLLALWMCLGIAGMIIVTAAANAIPNPTDMEDPVGVQLVVMLIGALIISWVPISGAVECTLIIGCGGSPRNSGDRLSNLSVTLVAVAMSIGVTALFAASAWRHMTGHVTALHEVRFLNRSVEPQMLFGGIPIGLAILCSALTARGVFLTFYARAPMQRMRAMIIVLSLCIVPLVLDLARIGYGLADELNDSLQFSALVSFSPVGIVLAVLASSRDIPLHAGLAFQVAVAVLFTFLGRSSMRNRLDGPPAAPPTSKS